MIIYLTYNEQPSGIFSSQVIDVVRFMNEELKTDVKLVSFISIRNFYRNYNKIKNECPKSIVIPMFPGIKRWKWNRITLKLLRIILTPRCVIARSVLATNLALDSGYKKVIYDGRGAITAEWQEYNVVNDKYLIKEINALEQKAVKNTCFKIAVSNHLVKYWETTFNYQAKEYVVIPCTLNKFFESISLNESIINTTRKKLGFNLNDIVFVYSGSTAGWQSMELISSFLIKQLSSSNNKKVLFLTESDQFVDQLKKDFPEQVINKKVNVNEVPELLCLGDYGILIRGNSITNKVASPVKFAEYLSCGLKIIISEELGDYSDLVLNNNWGYIFNSKEFEVVKPTIQEKQQLASKAKSLFCKANFVSEYKRIVTIC